MPAARPSRSLRGLRTRMATAALSLAGLYAVLIALLVVTGAGAVAVAVIVAVLFLAQYLGCERIALAALGARGVGATQEPELRSVVDALCVRAQLPMPRLAVVPSAMPNAFTVGRTPSTATVCVTSGLLGLLDESELSAVLAHELTHIANRDVVVVTVASFFASVAAFATRIGARGGDDEDGEPRVVFPALILSGLVCLVSQLVVGPLSRERELAADRGAARITGSPGALAAALERIAGSLERASARDLRGACGELACLYVVAPDVGNTVASLFDTHPSLTARLHALRRLPVRYSPWLG